MLEPSGPPQVPDMSPFFLKPYSVSQTKDIFHNYPIILTEMLLRLPYQIQKSWSQLSFEAVCILNNFINFKILNQLEIFYSFIRNGYLYCVNL